MAPTAALLQENFKTARSCCRQPGNVFVNMLSELNHLASSHVKRPPHARNTGEGAPDYHAWHAMIARCHKPSHPNYQTYGARGITVCDRWRASFEVFLSNEGSCPAPNLNLDRIDNNRGCEPSNIRSTTKSVQQKNRRPSSEWRRTA